MGIFTQAQERGWIGKQSLDSYIDHSLSFAKAARTIPSLAVDVGNRRWHSWVGVGSVLAPVPVDISRIVFSKSFVFGTALWPNGVV